MKPSQVLEKILSLKIKLRAAQLQTAEECDQLRMQCEHEWVYESDPSGNNDSGYACVCGAWSKNPYKKS